ncbi:MAG: hypothetical protein AB2417_11910 [Clostridiaceae bacterium]
MLELKENEYITPLFLVSNINTGNMIYYNYVDKQFYVDYFYHADSHNSKWSFIAVPVTIALINILNEMFVKQNTVQSFIIGVIILLMIILSPTIFKRYMIDKREDSQRFMRRLQPIDFCENDSQKTEVKRLFKTQIMILIPFTIIVIGSAILFLISHNFLFGFLYILGYPLLYMVVQSMQPYRKYKFMKKYCSY